jgi:hypothetical protein
MLTKIEVELLFSKSTTFAAVVYLVDLNYKNIYEIIKILRLVGIFVPPLKIEISYFKHFCTQSVGLSVQLRILTTRVCQNVFKIMHQIFIGLGVRQNVRNADFLSELNKDLCLVEALCNLLQNIWVHSGLFVKSLIRLALDNISEY